QPLHYGHGSGSFLAKGSSLAVPVRERRFGDGNLPKWDALREPGRSAGRLGGERFGAGLEAVRLHLDVAVVDAAQPPAENGHCCTVLADGERDPSALLIDRLDLMEADGVEPRGGGLPRERAPGLEGGDAPEVGADAR